VTGIDSRAVPVEASDTTSLRWRVRSETSVWHDRVDAVAGGPNTVESRGGYIDLLGRLYELHTSFESRLADPRLHGAWRHLGIDLPVHRRAHLCADDLETLGAAPANTPVTSSSLATSGHALGCLYVLEGSSLGGRVVARIVRDRIGNVPVAFFTGRGRAKLAPWTSVLKALTRFDTEGGDGDTVIAGACDTFATFASHLAGPRIERSVSA
jgi:heme oxygenase (biliverdin-IX-beta and delta-forming)